MKELKQLFFRILLLAIIFIVLWWSLNTTFSYGLNLSVIVVGVLLTFPLIWLGRKILDRNQTKDHAVRITTLVHFGLGFTFGVPIARAVGTYQDWTGWALPIPSVIGLLLVIITGAAFILTVINLALKGLGAPFFISLSQKLAADWMYAWTRNPMVLAGISFLVSLGVWFQSTLFVLWALIVFTPALLFFIKFFEERELELRFGKSYREYKTKTPMLFPRKPKN